MWINSHLKEGESVEANPISMARLKSRSEGIRADEVPGHQVAVGYLIKYHLRSTKLLSPLLSYNSAFVFLCNSNPTGARANATHINATQEIQHESHYPSNFSECTHVPKRSCCYSCSFASLFQTNSICQEDHQLHLCILGGGHSVLKVVQGGRFHHHQVRAGEHRFCRAALLQSGK